MATAIAIQYGGYGTKNVRSRTKVAVMAAETETIALLLWSFELGRHLTQKGMGLLLGLKLRLLLGLLLGLLLVSSISI